MINLENNAYVGKMLQGDLKEHYSLCVEKSRIIYTVEKDKIIFVIAMGPRKSVPIDLTIEDQMSKEEEQIIKNIAD